MATPLEELDLPELDLFGLGRREAIDLVIAARQHHPWLAKTMFGYSVTRYEDVVAILRDRRWHSALATMSEAMPNSTGPRNGGSILTMEGPNHARLRRLAAPAFTPKSADRLRPFMREVMNSLVDKVAATGRCELVEDVCEPYPIPIICELLGAPKEDWKLFSNWATDIFRIFNGDWENDAPLIEAASAELDRYVRDLIAQRRGKPGDDLLSDFIAAEEDGDRMSTDELVMMTDAVLMAGTDTTRNQLACSVALFTENPEQWALLAERPELASGAVEETMRMLGAVRGTSRVASEEIEYRDVVFPAGTVVGTSLGNANFDETVFNEPFEFDITRFVGENKVDKPQMTFGSGIHFCMGANLARAELQEALPLLARRMPDLTVADGAEIEWKAANIGIWGPAKLPLAFTPTA
jgi:cytochrome P450